MPIDDKSGQNEGYKIVPPSIDEMPSGQMQNICGFDDLSVLKSNLDCVRDKYIKGNYIEADARIPKLESSLELIRSKYEGDKNFDFARFNLLSAATSTISGLIKENLGQKEDSQKAFEKAVKLFDKWMPTKGRLNLAKWMSKSGKFKDQDYRDFRDYGLALYNVGRKKESIAALEEAVILDDPSPETYRYLGIYLKDNKEYEKAKQLLRKSLKLAPNNIQSFMALAEILEEQKRFNEAVVEYQNACYAMIPKAGKDEVLALCKHSLDLNQNDPRALARGGEILCLLNEYEEAMELFNKAIGLKKDDPWILGRKGEALRMMGRYEESLGALNEALSISPADYWLLGSKGAVLISLEKYDEALEVLDQSLVIDPNYVLALVKKSEVFYYLGMFKETLDALDLAISLEPDNFQLLSRKGEVLQIQGRNEEALVALDKALLLRENDPWLLGRKGEAIRLLGRDQEALKWLDKAIEHGLKNSWVLSRKGAILASLGKYDEALAILDQAISFPLDDIFALKLKRDILHLKGLDEEALTLTNEALSLEADNASLLGLKGETLCMLNRYEEALNVFDQAISMKSDDPWILGRKGDALRMLGRYSEARDLLNMALMLNDHDAWLLATLGQVCRALDLGDEAVAKLKASVELDSTIVWAYEELIDALIAIYQYEEAYKYINRAIELNPGDIWLLGTKGRILSDISNYSDAIKYIDLALQIDSSSAWLYSLKGWALMNRRVEPQRGIDVFEEARKVYKFAISLEPDNLRLRMNHGNVLYLMGRKEEAEAEFKWVIDETKLTAKEFDADTLHLVGWCYYRKKENSEAIRFLIDAVSLNPDLISAKFDLALVLMSNGQYKFSLEAYKNTVKYAQKMNEFARAGWLSVAKIDLEDAIRDDGTLKVNAQESLDYLEKALDEVRPLVSRIQ